MHKILIVEDDKKLREELEIFLNKNGYKAESLEDFSNTIEDILNRKVDLVLLDINLPGFDGEYVLREIRKVSEVPIIIITSKDNEMDELLSMNYGADHYVTKPFNIQILLAKINSVLRRSSVLGNGANKIDCHEFILNISKSLIEKDDKKNRTYKKRIKNITFFSTKKRKDCI